MKDDKATGDFIAEAKLVDLETVFSVAGGDIAAMRRQTDEYVGPCPACGGRDRFTINFGKGLWHCRQCDGGKGGDGLALVAQVLGYNLRARSGLLAVCAEILGRDPPAGSETETDDERRERQHRLERRVADRDDRRRKQDEKGERRRQWAISQGRGYWFNAGYAGGTVVEDYLRLRTGAGAFPASVWENLRFAPRFTCHDGKDDRGHDIEIHRGPAMIAPMIDLTGHVTGSHQTWIDLGNGPKFRPDLGLDAKGEPRVSKKMRGHHRASLIPISGDLAAPRWLVGEGIETTIAVAARDGWREDTFYFAAGSLGNMAGSADPDSGFTHPTLKKQDAAGRLMPVRVAGPVPKPGAADDCFQILPHVRFLILLADGDSEPVMTFSAMARAEARLARDGLETAVWWPPEKTDFAALAAAERETEKAEA